MYSNDVYLTKILNEKKKYVWVSVLLAETYNNAATSGPKEDVKSDEERVSRSLHVNNPLKKTHKGVQYYGKGS